MNDEHIECVHKLQQKFFGQRYVEAKYEKIKHFDKKNIEKISQWLENPKNFLVVLGPPGTGKTYLCSAMLELLMKKLIIIRCYNGNKFLNRLKYVMNQLIEDDLIIIDGIEYSKSLSFDVDLIFEFFDKRYESMKPTIVTSHFDAKTFKNEYGDRVASRIFAKENAIIDLSGVEDLRAQGL